MFLSTLLVVAYISSTRAKEDIYRVAQRQLEGNPYVYSKMAVLDPDPLLVDDDAKREALKEKYGNWRFWDGEEAGRPTSDYCGEHKYRDISSDEYPEGAWQKDAVFVNHILHDAENLITRAMEAIFSDYGMGKPLPPEAFQQRKAMFEMLKLDLTTQTTVPEDYEVESGQRLKGGWTTQRSYEGLVRRLLHAMMSNDDFVVVLGGDAASAGHGNHFRQSYLMQFHRIFSPMMARMGVKLVTRNMAMGHGLGTGQSSLGFSSLFGQDIDVLIWDGAMTELDAKYVDLFFRQGLLSSGKQGKIPFLLIGGNSNTVGLFDLMRWFHNEAGADVGQLGTAFYGVPFTESEEQAENITHAFRYLRCKPEEQRICNEHKYCTRCWLDRTDIPNPKELFPHLESDSDNEAARSWYPGWRQHELLGRTLAYTLLDALQDAVQRWVVSSFTGPPLEDEKWHVTDMYKGMRSKISTALSSTTNEGGKLCYELAQETLLPERICRVLMKGATHHTPRPNRTSIAELVVTSDESLIPSNPKKVLYEGQDVHNQCLDAGNVDVAQVLNLRRRLSFSSIPDDTATTWKEWEVMPPIFQLIQQARILSLEKEATSSKQRLLGDDNDAKDNAGEDPKDNAGEDPKDIESGDPKDNETGDPKDNETEDLKDDETGDPKDNETGDQKDDETGDQKDDETGDPKDNETGDQKDDETGDPKDNETGDPKDNETGDPKDDASNVAKDDPKDDASDGAKDDPKDDTITLGKGWSIHGEKPGVCTGEYLAICGRDSSDSCPLLGYHDSGGAIVGLDVCGWLVLDIPQVEHGILILKYALYDGNRDQAQLPQSDLRARRVESGVPRNENFRFEFAIDGQVTSWNEQELLEHTKTFHRRMETVTLMDNAEFTKEPKTVRLAIRIKECGESCVLALSHVYWA